MKLTLKSLEKRIDDLEARLVKVEPVKFESEPYQTLSPKAREAARKADAEKANK